MGIVGIERKIEEKRKETDKNISEVLESTNSKILRNVTEWGLWG